MRRGDACEFVGGLPRELEEVCVELLAMGDCAKNREGSLIACRGKGG